jgi:hypothetical protein
MSASGPGITVALEDTEPHGGQRSLRIRSEREVVWVRSDPIPAPATGRIAVWGWIRSRDKSSQSPLRLAIEGKVDGKTYYRYATVGGGKGPPIPSVWTQYWFQIDDLPSSELSELRIGIDLMGPGDVSIDDLSVYDLWFHDNERDELVKQLGIAGFQLGHGRLLDSHRYLDGYWPRFLEAFVPGEPAAVEFTGTSVPSGAAPNMTATPRVGIDAGRPGDRVVRPPSASLRRIGPIRPRNGVDSRSGDSVLSDPNNRPPTGRPPEKPTRSTPTKDRQPVLGGEPITGGPTTGGPTTGEMAVETTTNGASRVAESPPSAVRPMPARGADQPAAETTWRQRLESMLPKRFW